jgi:hypothetical protein
MVHNINHFTVYHSYHRFVELYDGWTALFSLLSIARQVLDEDAIVIISPLLVDN